MGLPKPISGLVVNYAFLWDEQKKSGLEDGLKNRPCAIVAAIAPNNSGENLVYVLPITHSEPRNKRYAVEIPPLVKKHLGLDTERSWIICNETNEFLWPGFDLCPTPRRKDSYGVLPPMLFKKVKARFTECFQRKELKVVNRDAAPRP